MTRCETHMSEPTSKEFPWPAEGDKLRSPRAQRLRPMSKHLQRDMDNIHREILSLSAIVEEMIDKATLSLHTRRYELAAEVIEISARSTSTSAANRSGSET